MSLNVGNLPVTAVYVGSTPVKAVYVGSKMVWSSVVKITGTTGTESQDQFRAALTSYGYDYSTITQLPFMLDTSTATDLDNLFAGCGNLTSVPALDMSAATNLNWMFSGCVSLTSVPQIQAGNATTVSGMFFRCRSLTTAPALDTPQVVDMSWLFGDCTSLASVPDLDTANVTNLYAMFSNCTSLTDGNVRLIGRHPQASTTNMIDGSGLTREPFYDVVKITLGTGMQARDQFRAALSARGLDYTTVTEIPFDIELVGTGSVQEMFLDCAMLTSLPAMDTSNVTNMYAMFRGCGALTHAPDLDTSSVTNMQSMFNTCSSLTYVPAMDTSLVTGMAYMFYGCSSLTDGNVLLIGRHPNVTTTDMITNSGLTREPFLETVQITLGTGTEARDQFRAALSARGLNYQTVEVLPFVIELVGTGSTERMFSGCSSLTHVPDMDTSLVTKAIYMFDGCAALTDGNVRLIGRHPQVTTAGIISDSGLTRAPFYDAAGNPI